MNVVRSVAAQANVDPLDLPPLYNSVDPEVLERSFEDVPDGNIQFEYAGYSVTVNSDESVDVGTGSANSATPAESALDD